MKKATVKTKFLIGASVILLLFCSTASILAYLYLKNLVTASIFKETEIFIATADATRTYVKDVLRPSVGPLLPADTFLSEAMSTSFVGREVMSRLRARFPDFQYKRAAGNPLNPINRADDFESSMLQWFATHRSTNEWHGLIRKDHRSFYTRLRAIYAEPECLACHGDPADAPAAMKARYGTDGGFGYHVGQVVAADTIYIPVDVSLARIKDTAWMVFILAITALFSLILMLYILFNRTAVTELRGLLTTFRGISGSAAPPVDRQVEASGDEVEQLKAEFESVAADLKQSHDGLKASESKYRLLFESSQDAIVILDDERHIVDINQAAVRLFGFADARTAQKLPSFDNLFQQAGEAERFFRTVRTHGFLQGREYALADLAGRKLTVILSATVRQGEDGRFIGIDLMLHDVTASREIEKHLAHTEKLASIGQLASGVAHEINNPLGVIQIYANLIAQDQPPEAQTLKDVQVIQKHSDQCRSIVEALLNFARVSEPKIVEFDIHRCIEDVLSVLELQIPNDRIRLERDYAENLPTLTGDEHKLKQVLMNLCMNARQAIVDGGRITVRTACSADRHLVTIAVSDSGVGITPEDIDRIFDPFFTTKGLGRGTGLGLSVSYGIVQQHGGRIEVDSRVGHGSTFTVVLPVTPHSGEKGLPCKTPS